MERTLTLETCALKAASRQWNRLSPEVQRLISSWTLFVHRTAHLIKDLEFTRHNEADDVLCRPARLHARAAPYAYVLQFRLVYKPSTQVIRMSTQRNQIVSLYSRHYDLPDFGHAEYDRYQIESDIASGIILGRVLGTERWGHEP